MALTAVSPSLSACVTGICVYCRVTFAGDEEIPPSASRKFLGFF